MEIDATSDFPVSICPHLAAPRTPISPVSGKILTNLVKLRLFSGLAKTFILERGRAFKEIRDEKLYKKNYDTFAEYCERRWNMDVSTVYKYIRASAFIDQNVAKVPQNFDQNQQVTKNSVLRAIAAERAEQQFQERMAEECAKEYAEGYVKPTYATEDTDTAPTLSRIIAGSGGTCRIETSVITSKPSNLKIGTPVPNLTLARPSSAPWQRNVPSGKLRPF